MINELQVGSSINSIFINGGAEVRQTRAGKDYLHVRIVDKTGSISGNLWDAPEKPALEEILSAKFLRVSAVVEEYMGNLNLRVNQVEALSEAEEGLVDLSELLHIEEGYYDEIYDDMAKFIEQHVKDEDIKMLGTEALFALRDAYKIPAAIAVHHSGLNGMAVHSYQAMKMAYGLLEPMKRVMTEALYQHTLDYAIVGAMLHDVGKVVEYQRDEFGYCTGLSLEGRLLGHLLIGSEMVRDLAQLLGIGEGKILLMRHILASHHGKQEHGAIMTPATLAAAVVNMADEASAALQPMALKTMTLEPGEMSTNRLLKYNGSIVNPLLIE